MEGHYVKPEPRANGGLGKRIPSTATVFPIGGSYTLEEAGITDHPELKRRLIGTCRGAANEAAPGGNSESRVLSQTSTHEPQWITTSGEISSPSSMGRIGFGGPLLRPKKVIGRVRKE